MITIGIKTKERDKTMKNKKFTFVALAMAAIATSCSNDGLADGSSQSSAGGKTQSMELTASLNDDNSTDEPKIETTTASDDYSSGYHACTQAQRYLGMTVRPVAEKQ